MFLGKKGTYLRKNKENQALLQKKEVCDKYDYLTAVACGAIGGLVDIFFVGSAKSSVLQEWTDQKTDEVVKKFAKVVGWEPRETQQDNVASAIGFLEKKYKVNYDQRHTMDVDREFNMRAKNHHMMSLAHAPDLIGLFFSILNQFTSTSSFMADGKLITIKTKTFELQGRNFVAKIFCGIANWVGHLMSDIAGSSGSRGNGGRGTGIVIPFFELFQCCQFGKFSVQKDLQDVSTIALRAFEEGYDCRMGIAMAIPLVITELSIRLIWSIKQHFYLKKPLKESIPNGRHDDLRMMLLLGEGTLCVMDGADAAVRSSGNILLCFMRLNIIAWTRFILLVLKEICIRIGLREGMANTVEVYKEVNYILKEYIEQLKVLDIELFEKETKQYDNFIMLFSKAKTNKDLNRLLLDFFVSTKINQPWTGNFDKHMSDKNKKLIFK